MLTMTQPMKLYDRVEITDPASAHCGAVGIITWVGQQGGFNPIVKVNLEHGPRVSLTLSALRYVSGPVDPPAPPPARNDRPLFAPVLRELRDRARLSRSRLAEAAVYDHSYVQRIESGTRMPTRDAVLKLAEALRLNETDRDALLAAAGFMPGRIESLLCGEPVIVEALALLQNPMVPAEVRADVRNMIALLVKQAQRTARDRASWNQAAGG